MTKILTDGKDGITLHPEWYEHLKSVPELSRARTLLVKYSESLSDNERELLNSWINNNTIPHFDEVNN